MDRESELRHTTLYFTLPAILTTMQLLTVQLPMSGPVNPLLLLFTTVPRAQLYPDTTSTNNRAEDMIQILKMLIKLYNKAGKYINNKVD